MHETARRNAELFFKTYTGGLQALKIVEIGSQDVNGSIREYSPETATYIGLDFSEGKGVDLVLGDPYSLPFETESLDVVVSSSCFEHSEFFWLLFNEIMRVLKPEGLFYLNVPSNGPFHRYPVDCWRFYPDSGNALVAWAQRSGYNSIQLESFTTGQDEGIWNDFVSIFLKNKAYLDRHPNRILTTINNYTNGLTYENNSFHNIRQLPEDMAKLKMISEFVSKNY